MFLRDEVIVKKIPLICLCFGLLSQAVEGSSDKEKNHKSEEIKFAELLDSSDSSATSASDLSEKSKKLLATRKTERAAYREMLKICLKGESGRATAECKEVLKNWLSDKSSSKKEDSKKESSKKKEGKTIPAYQKLLSLWLKSKDDDSEKKTYEEILLNWLQIKETLEIAYEVLLEKWLAEKDPDNKELYRWELRTLSKNGEPTVEDLLNKGKQDVGNIIKSVIQMLYRHNLSS